MTQQATHRSELQIEAKGLSINDLFKDFYAVPDFQREYVWQPENVEELLSDICEELYDEEGRINKGSEYFIGSVVVYKDERGVYHLIDGQQRTTTVFIILCILRDRLPDMDTIKALLREKNLNQETYEEENLFRVTLLYEDSAGALESIAMGNSETLKDLPQTQSVKNIHAAYDEAKGFLEERFRDDVKAWKQFVSLFTNQVKLVRIITPSQSSALRVFETINNTGVGLNSMDLLKNLLFRKVKKADYEKIKQGWKELTKLIEEAKEKPLRFLRYFILSRYDTKTPKPLPEEDLYDWISRNSANIGIDAKPLEFLQLLVKNAEAYRNLSQSRDPQGRPNRYLDNIQRLSGRAKQHFILLLAGQHLNSSLFELLCKELENLYFCFIVTREATKAFEAFFYKEAKSLLRLDPEDMEGVDAFITKTLHPEMSIRAEKFKFAFESMTSVNMQKYRLKYVLAKLTQHVDEVAWSNLQDTNLGKYLDRNVNIEHIIPETPTPEWVKYFDKPEKLVEYIYRLGNLTLLEDTLNKSVQQDAFTAKCSAYRKSAFLLTRSIAEKPTFGSHTRLNMAVEKLPQWTQWHSTSIDERQKTLTDLAFEVWGIPTH